MYKHQQYLRHVNLTRFTVRLKREKEQKSTLSGAALLHYEQNFQTFYHSVAV